MGVGIIGSNIFGSLIISAPDCFEVSDASDGLYSSSILLKPSHTQVYNMVYFRLKGDLPEGGYSQNSSLIADNLSESIALSGRVLNENVELIPSVDDEPFVFFNGNDLVVNAAGELQIIDIMGRYVSKYDIHNSQTVIPSSVFPNSGVYILRLCGDNVRTQKVVVRRHR